MAEKFDHLDQLNRMLAAIRKVNQLIVREKDPTRLLEDACRLLVETHGFYNVWIALTSDERPVEPIFQSGFDEQFAPMTEFLRAGLKPKCAEEALTNGRMTITDDPANQCTECPLATAYSGRAGMSLPLEHAGQTFGWMTLSCRPELVPDLEERELIEELAGDLAFALSSIETERKLQEGQKLFRDVLDAMPEMVWLKDGNGVYLMCNKELANLVDSSQEKIIGGTDYDIFPKEKADSYRAHDQLAVEKGGTTINEETADFVHGGYSTWIETSKTPVYNKQGGLIGVLGIGRDLGRRGQTLEESDEKQTLLNMVVDCSPVPTWIGSPNGVTLRANQALYSSLNLTPEQLVGKYNLLEDENFERPDIAIKLDQVLKTKNKAQFEVEWKAESVQGVDLSGGANLYFDASVFPLLNPHGEISHLVVQWVDITERWKAEEKLKAHEKVLSDILEDTLSGYWDWNLGDNTEYLSPAFKQMFGFMDHELENSPESWKELIFPEDLAKALKTFDKHVKTHGAHPYSLEVRYRHKNGSTVWVICAGRVIEWSDCGAPLRMVGCHVDITALKEAEEAQRANERLLLETQKIAHIAHWTFDPMTGMPFWSEELYKIYGRNPEDGPIPYSEHPKLVHPEDWDWFDATVKATAETGDPFDIILRIVHPDGTVRFINSICQPVLDEEGKVLQMRGTIQDVTKLKEVEIALRESEKQARLMADLVMDSVQPVAVGYLDGSLGRFNPAFCNLTGYTEEELLAIDWATDLTPPEWRAAEAEALAGLKSTGAPVRFEKEYIRKDGSRVPIELLAHMTADTPEGPGYLYAFVTDISERKQAESEKEKLESRLRQAQKMEAVGRLAGGVAHDFNNMLGVILGHSDIILGQMKTDDELHLGLSEIKKASERSADLTRQLLAFARKQTVSPQVIDLNDTVSGMIKMLQRLIGEDIALVWHPGQVLWSVKIDPSQIDQIMANLCVNGRDAIADVGRLTIETGNTSFDDAYCQSHEGFIPGEYVMLAVSDDGCGMKPETMEYAFEPFFTTKEPGKGTGLGLATVYGVVKQNEGFVNIYSEPDLGTTIKIYLPRHASQNEQDQASSPAAPTRRGEETVLLVEDELAILNMAQMMLEGEGYTVLAAETPGLALELARSHSGEIHMLMADVVMPEMNGRDLARNVMRLYPEIKRLFMSGYTADVIAHHGVLDEGVNFIQKPFSKDKLAATVREVLGEEVG